MSVNCINSPSSENEYQLYSKIRGGKFSIVQDSSSEGSYPDNGMNQGGNGNDDDDDDEDDDYLDAEAHTDGRWDDVYDRDEGTDKQQDYSRFEDETGFERMIRKAMDDQHKLFVKTLCRFEKSMLKDVKAATDKNYRQIEEFMDKKCIEMEQSIERKIDLKYEKKLKAYEDRVIKLEKELEQKAPGKMSHEDLTRVRNNILDSMQRSDSFKQGIDNIVKKRLEDKIKEGELVTDNGEVKELKDNVSAMRRTIKDMSEDIELLNPDPFEQEHLCVVCSGVQYTKGENSRAVALEILTDLKNILYDHEEEFQCEELQVIGAKRLGSPNAKYRLLKIALGSQEQKVAVLKAKHHLAKSEKFSSVRVRTSKSNITRAMEDNILLMKEAMPELDNYRLAANSRLVRKDRRQPSDRIGRGGPEDGWDNGDVRGEQGRPRRVTNPVRRGRGAQGGRGSRGGRGGRGGSYGGRGVRDASGDDMHESGGQVPRRERTAHGHPTNRGASDNRDRGRGINNVDAWGSELFDNENDFPSLNRE